MFPGFLFTRHQDFWRIHSPLPGFKILGYFNALAVLCSTAEAKMGLWSNHSEQCDSGAFGEDCEAHNTVHPIGMHIFTKTKLIGAFFILIFGHILIIYIFWSSPKDMFYWF